MACAADLAWISNICADVHHSGFWRNIIKIHNPEERIAYDFLIGQGYSAENIFYEPLGASTCPDFLLNEFIAIEVRRLNQHEFTKDGVNGLEVRSIPLIQKIIKISREFPPASTDISWLVYVRFKRPLIKLKPLSEKIKNALQEFSFSTVKANSSIIKEDLFELRVIKSYQNHPSEFIFCGYTDRDKSGSFLEKMHTNIQYCMQEKSGKMMATKSKILYEQQWLILINQIGNQLTESEIENLRSLVTTKYDWDRVIVIDPINPSLYFTL